MKKISFILTVFVALSIFGLSISPSFARGPMNKHRHNGELHVVNSNKCRAMDYDYDYEYLSKILKQDKKTFKISKNYLEKLKTSEVKVFAQAVIDKKEKQIEEMQRFIEQYKNSKK
jgi:uncharacterized protein (DUF305 family)